MKSLNFDNASFVLYQILPNHKKIEFLNDSFTGNIFDISKKFYENHFIKVVEPDKDIEVGILSYITHEGDKLNIFFHDGYMHVNCNKLIPIRELVHAAFSEGNILFLDKTKKKNKTNREQYHMRYYRAYKKLNPDALFLPISLS